MLFVSQFAVFQFPTVKAQEECLKIYYDSEKGYYYFLTLNGEKVVLERSGFAVLNRWDGEAWISFGSFPSEGEVEIEVEAELAENKLKWKGKWKIGEEEVEVEIELEPKNISEYGDLEWSMKLTDNLPINVFSMPIQSENLKFFYQPPLYEEYGFSEPFSNSTFFVNATHVMEFNGTDWITTTYRPENVVGSYAVYHAYKMNNEYKTGKAFHIYRPKLIDAEGKTAWAELSIDEKNGVLTITLPQDFLDKAVYPVTIDPTFGYETAGASFQDFRDRITGSVFTCPEDGTADSISFYGGVSGTFWKCAIYRHSDSSLIGATDRLGDAMPVGWHTNTFTDEPTLTNIDYVLVVWSGYGYGSHIYYDAGEANQGHYQSLTYNGFPDPASFSHEDRKYSIYCTYTAGGEEAQEYSHTFIETLNPSVTLNLWQAQAYKFTQTLVTTSTYNYGVEATYTLTQIITSSETISYYQEHIWLMQETLQSSSTQYYLQEQSHILIQTITPSETVTYMQEQKYVLIETVNPSSSFQHWIEGITIIIETFTETIKPKTTMHYWKELNYEFPETFNPQTTFNYAAEIAETFITIIETLKPKATMIPILPAPAPEEINWGIIALCVAMLAFVLVTSRMATERD